jgi:hypothetical protein
MTGASTFQRNHNASHPTMKLLNPLRTACAAASIVLTFFAGVALAADPRDIGPRTLVITYHTAPANRVAFHQELEHAVTQQLQRWKDEGVLQNYRVLSNRYVDSSTWDAMALLTFGKDADLERWKKIEQETPAGLTPKALALTSAIDTIPADLMRRNGTTRSAEGSVFVVIPYETVVALNDYIAYLDGYVLPQTDGWMNEGVLASYGVYTARYPAGRPWQSLLVLEYKSERALGERDAAVAKVRARLKNNSEWKAISDSKKNVRNEKMPVIADPLSEGPAAQ